MDKLKNLSIKKTLFLIVAVTAGVVTFLSAVSVRLCSAVRDQILLSHAFILQPAVIDPEKDGSYTLEAEDGFTDNEADEYTDSEVIAFKTAQAMIVLLPVIFSFAGIACASSIFYRIKLKEPLDALGQGIVHIADNDLSFPISYQKRMNWAGSAVHLRRCGGSCWIITGGCGLWWMNGRRSMPAFPTTCGHRSL